MVSNNLFVCLFVYSMTKTYSLFLALNRNHQHHHHHHHHSNDENDMYLFNQHTNRGSFSSVSSHQSYLYPIHHGEEESKTSSVTTPTSYVDQIYNNHTMSSRSFGDKYTASPYIKSSPYTNTTTMTPGPPVAVPTPNNPPSTLSVTGTASVIQSSHDQRSTAGSTTPSSWFSPETPTAVLFQKDEIVPVVSKRRKASTCSLDSSTRATRRVKTEQD